MQAFCCISTLNERSQSKLPECPSMNSPPPARSDQAKREKGIVARRSTGGGDSDRQNQKKKPLTKEAAKLVASDQVKITDVLSKGICGVLYKWVNYGKGWRRRYFILQDGVLSYYKIRGPNKIVLNREMEKGIKVIGEVSFRRLSRQKNATSPPQRKPIGEVHLKVSSIRQSRSDDKRFSIFTGTKRLHLRAETREDRLSWLESLEAVKSMFPRLSNSELMAPIANVVSTEKLRQRLLEEGVREAAIQDSEQIMESEFAELQNQLNMLREKHWLLIDRLRQLEVHIKSSRKKRASRIRNSVNPNTN